jgi:hypothetical protein
MTTVERVARAIRENPEGLLLLGAGVALMLRHAASSATGGRARRATHRDYGRAAYDSSADGAANDTGEGLRDRVGAAAEDARNYVSDTAQDLSDKASEYGSAASKRTREAANGAYRATRDAASTAYRSIESVADAHPVTIAVAGLAAGCLAAAVFPPTRFERDTLGPIARRAAEAASETGKMVKSTAVERVTKAAGKAGEQLKEAAADPKLNTDNAGGAARDVASNASSTMTGSSTGDRKPGTRATNENTKAKF